MGDVIGAAQRERVWTALIVAAMTVLALVDAVTNSRVVPIVLLVLGPLYLFFVSYRFAHKKSGRLGKRSVLFTNLALLGLCGLAAVTIGLRTYLISTAPP